MKPFEIEVQHSAETVSDLARAQYAASHQTARLIQVITAVVCLLIGIRVIGHITEPFNYFFSLYGCLAIVFINVPAKSTADRTGQRKSLSLFGVCLWRKRLQCSPQGRQRKGRKHRLCPMPSAAPLSSCDLFFLK